MRPLCLAVVLGAVVLGAFAQAHAQAPPAASSKTKPAPAAHAAAPARRDAPGRLEPAVRFDAAGKPSEAVEDGHDVANAPRRGTPKATGKAPARRPARDTLDLGTTSITGNQELPKVLYIVPWKESDLGDVVGRPANTLLDDVLAPLDPAVFERRLKYYETLHGTKDKGVTR